MTFLREEELKALRGVELSGSVLDLGGDRRSAYQRLFRGSFTITVVNLDPKTEPDIVGDLEKPLPVKSKSYSTVLLVNVLEHIYEYAQLVKESARILTPDGKVIVVVPYLFPYHPSPQDFHRFSRTALERLFTDAGFVDIRIQPLGTGPHAARVVMMERLLPPRLQRCIAPITHAIARADDAVFSWLATALHKKYRAEDYALGFFLTARMP